MMAGFPQEVQEALAKSVPFPSRMGRPAGVCGAGEAYLRKHHAERRNHPAGRGAAHGAARESSAVRTS